jgi:hypothetical protein
VTVLLILVLLGKKYIRYYLRYHEKLLDFYKKESKK